MPRVVHRRAAASSAAAKRACTALKIAPDTPVSRAIAGGCRPNQKIVHVRIVLDPPIE